MRCNSALCCGVSATGGGTAALATRGNSSRNRAATNPRPSESRDPRFSRACLQQVDPGFRRDDDEGSELRRERIIGATSKRTDGYEPLYQPPLRNHASRGLSPRTAGHPRSSPAKRGGGGGGPTEAWWRGRAGAAKPG